MKGKCTNNNYPCLDLTGISPNSCRAQENGLFSASTMNFCRMNSIKSVFSYKILVDGHFTTFKSVKLICTIKRSLEIFFQQCTCIMKSIKAIRNPMALQKGLHGYKMNTLFLSKITQFLSLQLIV